LVKREESATKQHGDEKNTRVQIEKTVQNLKEEVEFVKKVNTEVSFIYRSIKIRLLFGLWHKKWHYTGLA